MAPQTTSWSFSWSSPTSLDVPWTWVGVKYAMWQLETLHDSTTQLRGYVRFIHHKRLFAVKALLPDATWLPCVGATRHEFHRSILHSESRVEGLHWTIGKDTFNLADLTRTSLPVGISMLRDGRTISAVIDRYPELETYLDHLQAYSDQLVREANKENEPPNAKRSRRHRG